jgi:hypothetical protein
MTALGNAIARLLLGLSAFLTAGWAVAFLSNPDASVQLNDIANRIMSGDAFQQKPLPASDQLLATAEGRAFCNPLEMRGAAIIRLRLVEDAINASDTRLVDRRLKSLQSSVDRALGCVPTEGFLWFMRYWGAIHAGGSASDHFDELRMSYVLAPYEGWVALRRSPYTLAVYGSLPDDLKEMARNEFVGIVASDFIGDAVKILQGPGWPVRDQLLPRLDQVRLAIRLQFDKALRSQGLTVDIPGVEAREFRPWQ